MKRTETEYSKEGLVIARDYERCLSTMCHHVSNDSYFGQNFMLEVFQRENMWKPLFACGEMTDRGFKRKYRRAIFGLPSGFGKTELAAALILTVATMEPIFNGQYGLVASSKDQVKNLFDKVKSMIKLDPIWAKQWNTASEIITHTETGAKIMVLPNKADALESWHFNVLVFDELHVYKDSSVWDAGLKGQKVLWNPLSIGITTAANSREGFLWDTIQKSDKDPGMYLYWLGVDDGKNLRRKSSWKDLLVASWVTWESIQDQMAMASTERAFERYTANRFPMTKQAESCFTAADIKKCVRGANDFDFAKPFTLGIDGATSGDSFAIIAYQESENKQGKTVAFTKEWVFDTPDEDTGTYNLAEIIELIAWICEQGYPDVIGIDPNRLIVMNTQLKQTYGIETVAFAQNNATMCSASAIVYSMAKSGRLKIKGCEKLQKQMLSTVKEERQPYGFRFGKDKNRSKIDATIALAIAALAYEKTVAGHDGLVDVMS